MVKPFRIVLVVGGLAVAIYGVASLTGGWLGTPPWWSREIRSAVTPSIELPSRQDTVGEDRSEVLVPYDRLDPTDLSRELRPGREWISAGVAVAGLALAAFAAWPRRPKRAPSA